MHVTPPCMRSQNKVTEYANGCDLCIQYSCIISFLSISIHHYDDDLVKKGWGSGHKTRELGRDGLTGHTPFLKE